MIRAGDLRHRVTLQRPVRSQNSFGEWIDTWTDVATVWAAVEPLSGNKYFAARQANADVSGTVRIRYRTDVRATWRVVFMSRVLQVVSMINTGERREEIQLLYKELLD